MRRGNRKRVRLECSECGHRNYTVVKRSGAAGTMPVLKKHCPHCNRHTEHREAK